LSCRPHKSNKSRPVGYDRTVKTIERVGCGFRNEGSTHDAIILSHRDRGVTPQQQRWLAVYR